MFRPADRVADEISDILSMVHEAYRALAIPAPRLRLSRARRSTAMRPEAAARGPGRRQRFRYQYWG